VDKEETKSRVEGCIFGNDTSSSKNVSCSIRSLCADNNCNEVDVGICRILYYIIILVSIYCMLINRNYFNDLY
jgi:hypothetical protein